ncbi:unnamed protein product [Nesidiocoris tenuis]|uniref:Uncharacterized protein n=1 Tax=Nesidiocoris tenuis TaxID=355587 RepID=A0A6H5GDN8_9HEMI|nr:unnamed protein product [Nesidiocoris tenuis]
MILIDSSNTGAETEPRLCHRSLFMTTWSLFVNLFESEILHVPDKCGEHPIPAEKDLLSSSKFTIYATIY